MRVVRRTAAGATTKEARLESDGVVLAGNARELDREVERTLGLDFDQFTKTVVLPQGDFARFLTETPEARQGLLRRLLGMELYRAMGSAARERAKVADTKHAALVEQQGDRPPVTAEHVEHARTRVELLESSRDLIVEHAEQLTAAEVEADHARSAAATTADHVDTLGTLKIPAGAKRLEKKLRALDEKRSAAHARAELAKASLAEAMAATEAAGSVAELQRIVERHHEATDLRSQIDEASAGAQVAARDVRDHASAEEQATAVLAERTEALDAARRRAGAAGLRDLLAVGEPCPVCEQTVDHLPTHDVHDELAALDESVEKARALADAAREASRTSQNAQALADARVESLQERLDELARSLDGAADLDNTSQALDDALAAQTKLDSARVDAQTSLEALEAIDEEVAELDDETAELRRDLTGARDRLIELDPPAPGEESIIHDWTDLVEWAEAALVAAKEAKKEASAKVRAAEKIVDRHRRTIAKALGNVAEGADVDDPVTWLAREQEKRNAALETLAAEHAAQSRTAERIEALHREGSVAGELGRLLSARGFEKWLMADAMHTLAARATDRLYELSGGTYSLLTDGSDFAIIDHRNADETRSARTLSGGETFLASLALALALADNIADLATDGAPAIESMFLDEGFGTLDPETLDVVASAIEELGSRGRLVGVVTHIRDLAERIPVRFEVSRTPNGSSVTRTTLD